MRIFNRVKPDELSAFLGNLSMLLKSGLTPSSALETMSEICGKSVKTMVLSLLDDVRNGADLSEAFAKQDGLAVFAGAVKAGEQSGRVSEILKKTSARLMRKNQALGKLKSAMYYPLFILFLTFCAAIYMLKFIVPQFQTFISETTGGGLPTLTVLVISLSELITRHWIILILLILCGVFSVRWLIKNPFKMRFAAFKLKIPIVGEILRGSDYAEFFDSLAFLLDAGLTASKALKSAAETVKNPHIKDELNIAYKEMTASGKSLAAAVSELKTVSAIERQCIAVAEYSGKLCEALREFSADLNTENEQRIKRLTAIFEPLATVLVGAVVGVIMLAMYLPMISIMQI